MISMGIVGLGHMGSALIAGLRQAHEHLSLMGFDTLESNSNTAQERWDVLKTSTLMSLCEQDWVILAIKPDQAQSVCEQLARSPLQPTGYISIMAGVTCQQLSTWLNGAAVIRMMPNLPVAYHAGVLGWYADTETTLTHQASLSALFQPLGEQFWLSSESQLSAITAISGSGPAYHYYWLNHLSLAASTLGLSDEQALSLTLQTAKGAMATIAHSPLSLAALQDAVTSPGGTTAAALNVLEVHQVDAIMRSMLTAARDKAQALSEEISHA